MSGRVEEDLIFPEAVNRLREMYLDGIAALALKGPVPAEVEIDKLLKHIRRLHKGMKDGLILDLLRCMVQAELDLAMHLKDQFDGPAVDPRE